MALFRGISRYPWYKRSRLLLYKYLVYYSTSGILSSVWPQAGRLMYKIIWHLVLYLNPATMTLCAATWRLCPCWFTTVISKSQSTWRNRRSLMNVQNDWDSPFPLNILAPKSQPWQNKSIDFIQYICF